MESESEFKKIDWTSLFDVCRGRLVERTVYGDVGIFQKIQTGNKHLEKMKCFGSTDPEIFGRSLMKPFQMKPIAKDLAPYLSWEEKALSIASHCGAKLHLEFLEKMQKNSKSSEFLKVPESNSMGGCESNSLKSQISHPCSGKHLAVLRACEINSWDFSSYIEIEHEFNKTYFNYLEGQLAEFDISRGPKDSTKMKHLRFNNVESDGCGLPTMGLHLSEIAFLFCKLAEFSSEDWIWEAAHRHPYLVGGDGRVDSLIMKMHSNIFAKEGADGLLGIAIESKMETKEVFTGVVLKLAAGYDLNVLWILAHYILNEFGFAMLPPSSLPGQKICFNKDLPVFLSQFINDKIKS